MRRILLLLVGAALAVAGVIALQRLDQDRRYRGLLADGDAAMASSHTYLALEAYSGALAVKPDSMVAHYRRGEAYAAEGQDAQAVRDLHEARRLAPDAPEPLEALGRLHEGKGDFAAAAAWYGQAAERRRDTDARLLYVLALARYRTGALPAARDAARRAVARDATFAPAHYLAGLLAHDLQDPREAVGALEHAVRLQPSLLAAREELASVYAELHRFPDEAAQLRALASLDPQLDRYLALAMAQVRTADYPAAFAALASAEALAPGDSRLALALGRVHLAMAEAGDRDAIAKALTTLERALGGTARRSAGLALYGRALHLSGDTAGAERLLQDAIRTSPVDPAAFGYLADAAETLGHPLAARDALLNLDALEGNTAPSVVRAARTRRIGVLSLDGQDGAAAVIYLTQATRDAPDDSAAMGLLARALWMAGRRDDARRALGAALSLSNDDAALRRLERTLR